MKSKILLILLYLVSIVTGYLIHKINVIPNKYLIVVGIIYLIIILFISLATLTKSNKVIKIIANITSIIIILGSFILNLYIVKTLGFLNNIVSTYKTEEYYLIVLENQYNNIDELNNKNIGLTPSTSANALQALINMIDYTSVIDDLDVLSENLLNGEIDGLYILSSLEEMIEENNEDFASQIKILKTITIEISIDNPQVETKTDEVFNVYISGIDTYGDISTVSRSDVNIVATVNLTTGEILLIHIPRDYYVYLDGKDGIKDKLTHSGVYGIDCSVATIENLLDIDIDYYVKINFTSLIELINKIGDLEVYSDYTFTSGGYTYTKGYNTMNGSKTLAFVRERYTLPGGDRARGKNQERVIEAIIKKVSKSKTLLLDYLNIIDALNNNFATNLNSTQITNLVKNQINTMQGFNVTSISLDGVGSMEYTYTYGKSKLYVMVPDESTIENAKEMIYNILNSNNL
ncbi:MAG: LCP family protein [Bacilli bacterium]|nr:LCP family protein [Bacilli bacterium]